MTYLFVFSRNPVLMIIAMFFTATSFAQEKIIMGAIHIPPYYVISSADGNVEGLVPDLLNSIFSPINIKVKYKILSIERLKIELANGNIDGFPLVTRTESNINNILLSDAYLKANNYLWAMSSKYPNGIQWNSLSDLKKYKVGIIFGASYGLKTDEFIANNESVFYKASSSPLNIKLLLSGRLDAIISNEDIILSYNKNNIFVRSEKALHSNFYKIAISTKSKFAPRIKEFNKQIEVLNRKKQSN